MQSPHLVRFKGFFPQEQKPQSGKDGLGEDVSWTGELAGHEARVGGEQPRLDSDEIQDGVVEEGGRQQAGEHIGRAFSSPCCNAGEIASLRVEQDFDPADSADQVVDVGTVASVQSMVDGVLADDFADEVGDVVSALKVVPDCGKVQVLGGH